MADLTLPAGGALHPDDVVIEGLVALPRAEVWRRWTTSAGLADWWVGDTRVDLRVGGPFELHFHADGQEGLRGSEGCVFLSFVRERMVSFTWNAPPHLTTRGERTWVVIELEARGDQTWIRLTHTGWPAAGMRDSSSDWPTTFRYFQNAWQSVVDLLVASAED